MTAPAFAMPDLAAFRDQPSTPPAAPAQPERETIPAAVAVKKFRELRDAKAAIAERHALELKPYNDAMNQLQGVLLDVLNRDGADSVRTADGTAYRSTKTSFTIDDPSLLRSWVEANNRPDIYENRLSKESIEALHKETGQLPPGVKVSHHTTINIRK